MAGRTVNNEGPKRQEVIYRAGFQGKKPAIPVHPNHLEQAARAKLSREAFDYIAGGAGLEQTVKANRSSFDEWQIVPRVLHDVSEREHSVSLFGRRLSYPFLLAPIGVLEAAHPQADKAVATSASMENVPFIFSNQASVSMEECAAVMGDSPRWFQLYWSKSNDLVKSFIKRAEDCGCEAIVVTLDTTFLGWRTRDLQNAWLPFLHGMGIAQYLSDPVFNEMLEYEIETPKPSLKQVTRQLAKNLMRLYRRHPGTLLSNALSKKPLAAVQQFISTYSRPSLTWEDLPFLKYHTKLPVLVKGILHPDDAKKALDIGIDGIIVSNHGGRQIDGAIPSLTALPGVVEAVNGKVPILFDSGIRTGSDIFKALALGASAVCIGRPYAYGLALGGSRGVAEVIRNLKADFDLTMGLAGHSSLTTIDRECLRKS